MRRSFAPSRLQGDGQLNHWGAASGCNNSNEEDNSDGSAGVKEPAAMSTVDLVAQRYLSRLAQPVGASNRRLIVSNDFAEEPSSMINSEIGCGVLPLVDDDRPSNPLTTVCYDRYFRAVHGRASTRKHKVFEGDGFVHCSDKSVTLCDETGAVLGRISSFNRNDLINLADGSRLLIGGREVELQDEISRSEFSSGLNEASSARYAENTKQMQDQQTASVQQTPLFRAPKRYTAPLKDLNGDIKRQRLQPGQPLYEINGESLIMTAPDEEHAKVYNKNLLATAPVVVDPHVSRRLRDHQREGVAFIYNCLVGIRSIGEHGCILADDMGLGKSLQTIAAVWTLIKQGPYGLRPCICRVLLVCPSTLIQNWVDEFRKWLGDERLKTFALTKSSDVRAFRMSTNINPVCITSYEMASRYADQMADCGFDLLVCDEAQRLKNQSIKLTASLESLEIDRRLLLTGTPVQNDLQELYAVSSFANPACLGGPTNFRRTFEEPILAGQHADATDDEVAHSKEVLEELLSITRSFMLRRTSAVNRAYLPPKDEYVLFCRASIAQQEVYQSILAATCVQTAVSNEHFGAQHLVLIDSLRKLCNHPSILAHSLTAGDLTTSSLRAEIATDTLTQYAQKDASVDDSGKLSVLCDLLAVLHPLHQKVVIVSNYTMTLQLIECMCEANGYATLCLTGKTPSVKRQSIVDQFNSPYDATFVFLLSSKAGGCGLNLIGANRIVLFDVDWNPANDLQALARVWRDGQTKHCHVYRFATSGTIEEKIVQRQVKKQLLCNSVVDGGGAVEDENEEQQTMNDMSAGKLQFTREDLRDLFSVDFETDCNTHAISCCACAGDGLQTQLPRQAGLADLCVWQHYTRDGLCAQQSGLIDDCLHSLATTNQSLSFVMINRHQSQSDISDDDEDDGDQEEGNDQVHEHPDDFVTQDALGDPVEADTF